jgi:hypothetical protein
MDRKTSEAPRVVAAAKDYTALTKSELIISFSLVTSLFFLWGLSYGLLDVLNQVRVRCLPGDGTSDPLTCTFS